MQKSKTAAWKEVSSRNRHNRRVNAATSRVIEEGESVLVGATRYAKRANPVTLAGLHTCQMIKQ
jgi:hypothetical protein